MNNNFSAPRKTIKNIKWTESLGLLLLITVFVASIFISPFYYEGDQFHYRRVYELMNGTGILDAFDIYTKSLNSREFVHFGLIWISSNIEISKDVLMGCANAILAYFAYHTLVLRGGNKILVAIIILTNFYFLVLYFAAERLKFATLFFLSSVLFSHRLYFAATLSSICILTHIQAILYYLPVWNFVVSKIKKIKKHRKKLIALGTVLLVSAIYLTLPQFIAKSSFFLRSDVLLANLESMTKVLLFFLLSLFYCKDRKTVFYSFIPIAIAVFFLGGARVNMIGYFVFLYFAINFRRGFNIGILATQVYFIFSSYYFIFDILKYGNGFRQSLIAS